MMYMNCDKIHIETPSSNMRVSWAKASDCLHSYGIAIGFYGAVYLTRWEWRYEGRTDTQTEIIMVPNEKPERWFDDLVREREADHWFILGCIELTKAELPAYVAPDDYRAEIEKARAMWGGGDA